MLLVLPCFLAKAQPVPEAFTRNIPIRHIGPGAMSGRVTAIAAVDADPSVIYVGSASGGLWKSTSGGVAWQPIFDTLQAASIGALAVYQANPDIVWVGTGEGNPRNSQTMGRGIYRSLDAGRTWQRMGLEGTFTIHRICIHPQNPNVVYAAAQGTAWGETAERGIYRTQDGGKTWEKVLYVDAKTGAADLVMDPANPNKLIAAMWEYRRWPWFFKSGGPGSGLFITVDGGASWKRLGEDEGLPKGDLGRIGLAIARNNPQVVYALVEATKNGLYRSNDGGYHWELVSTKGIGGRPFYYAELYLDPTNENRIFNIHTTVDISEDGGKSFTKLVPDYGVPNGIHSDHHAWYINPNNPDFMIDGNDGGAAITHDRGKTWRYVENLPLGQFYHIAVDNQVPYRIYGGLQDNGSWVGPSRAHNWAGIHNYDYQEIYFGDGFDVVPDPSDPDYAYAMSQGGNVGRIHLPTGFSQYVQPLHPEGVKLRFNWNAGIAADPYNAKGVYFGSQFLHYSPDQGNSWQLLSPDLTTNDSTKQKAGESGGLTYDATNAENHTTILTIAPSSKERGVVWVGTDDGNVQLTRDGGKTWTNLAGRLPGMAAGSWVPQIVASKHAAGEAFVVVNDYRRHNWAPMLYHTTDYGATWKNLVSDNAVDGYCLSVAQDPVAPNLLFAGTEFGLYVSIDYGKTWSRWSHHTYPTLSTYDLVIQEAEADLVIGSFGRGILVVDDIRPLRALAQQGAGMLDKPLQVFATADYYDYQARTPAGARFAGSATYTAPNPPEGVALSFYVKEGKADPKAPKPAKATAPATTPAPAGKGKGKDTAPAPSEAPANPKGPAPSDTVKVEIVNSQGKVIRTFKEVATTGLNRVYWRLDAAGTRRPGQPKPKPGAPERGGGPTPTGTYTARMTYRGVTDSTRFAVKLEPNLAAFEANINTAVARYEALNGLQTTATELVDQLDEAKASIERMQSLMTDAQKADSTLKPLREKAKAYTDSLKALRNLVVYDTGEIQGIFRDVDDLLGALRTPAGYGLTFQSTAPTYELALRQAETQLRTVQARINRFLREDWPTLAPLVTAAGLSPLREVKAVER